MDTKAKLTRDQLRAKVLGGHPKAKSAIVSLFGQEVEIRQPTLAAILEAQTTDDVKSRAVEMIIGYTYVPGTDEKLFEEEDRAVILGWPFGDELLTLQLTIAKLTGVDMGKVEKAEVELATNPLKK